MMHQDSLEPAVIVGEVLPVMKAKQNEMTQLFVSLSIL